MKHWKIEKDKSELVWLCIDKAESKVNILSSAVLLELNEIIDSLSIDETKGMILWSGKKQSFILGADIKEISTVKTPDEAYKLAREGQQLFRKIEALPFPTVSVINGICLGGGFELAMAFKYRIALKSSQKIIGLPEVKLGLHPGFGGTVRAVRLAGVRAGMNLMLAGNPINPSKAKSLKFIDQITTEDAWRDDASRLVFSNPSKKKPPLIDLLLNLKPLRGFVKKILIKQVKQKARSDHYPAPYAMIDLWANDGASHTYGYNAEAISFGRLACSSTSRNLIRVFFLQTKLKSQGNQKKIKIKHVHVVGAGIMGGDIAAWCALKGYDVTLQDQKQEYVDSALKRAKKLFNKKIRGEDERQITHNKLQSDIEGSGVIKADLIIEAIYENIEAKQTLYKDLQSKMKSGALLATNTSSLQLEDLRTVLNEPQRFIGLHFFNPVSMLPLIEVIKCDDTDQSALDLGFSFARGIGKLPLECKSSPGFVVNRILAPYMNEAMLLADEGVALSMIDNAAVEFGMPMGPVELADSVGLDVALNVSKVLGKAYGRTISPTLEDMVNNNLLGRKSGQGYYQWKDGKVVKPNSKQINFPADVKDRLILPMLNESVACLNEKVIEDADLIDAGIIFGTGFAPFLGGPINYARKVGIDTIVKRLKELSETYGDRFQPNEGWSNFD
tara:strand:- start:1372 stop:3387 length:2016 start_codon:yes stop_codon:yes gene_type:complete